MARGYYLALTFGTLLSSQGADAHGTRPDEGPRPRRSLVVRRTTVRTRRSVPPAPDVVSRGAERKLRPSGGRSQPAGAVPPDPPPHPPRHVSYTRRKRPGQAVAAPRCTPATARLPRRRASHPPAHP